MPKRVSLSQVEGWWRFQNACGERFFSVGVNHFQPDCWLAPQNKELMLHRYGDDLEGSHGEFNQSGQGLRNLSSSLCERLKAWGFNTFGMHTYGVPHAYFADTFYYPIAIEYHPLGSRFKFGLQQFPDIFSQEFQSGLDRHIQILSAQHQGNENFLGYIFSDIPRWYFYEGQELDRQAVHPWVSDLLSMPASSAGYQAARQALGKETAESRADSDRVLAAVVKEWYRLHCGLLKRHDPGRLIFGDKLHSPHRLPTWFEQILANHVDAICIQWYTPAEQQQSVLSGINARTGLPIFNGDSSFGCPQQPQQTKVKGYPVDSKLAMGLAYADYLDEIRTWPFMLGWHHCGIMEQWDGAKMRDWEINENGFLDPFEEPYGPLLGSYHSRKRTRT